MAGVPTGMRLLRRFGPIATWGSTVIVTRYDDVREVFETDHAFAVPYGPHLDVITGGEPFILSMAATPQYHASLEAMRAVVLASDLPELGRRAETMADTVVAAAKGRLDVVSDLVRPVSFGLIAGYLGVPDPATGHLAVWGTRLFEFQFASAPDDIALRREVEAIAPALRAHIDAEIARRKAGGAAPDDVITRCLERQSAGQSGYSDTEIRTAILCLLVGGPPQPPMVVPQALEQLLRRPAALAEAQAAACRDDDDRLWAIVREGMRFDPLAPGLPRVATKDWPLARGTRRERVIPKGSTVIAAFASAMMDERRIPSPRKFDANRLDHEYIHFGHGLHACFGRHINRTILHRMIKPLLRRPALRRAPGRDGHLSKNGAFAKRLVMQFD